MATSISERFASAWNSIIGVLAAYPRECGIAAVATVAGIVKVSEFAPPDTPAMNALMLCILAFNLSVGLSYARRAGRVSMLIDQGLLVVFVALLAMDLFNNTYHDPMEYVEFGWYMVTSWLFMVMCVAISASRDQFWYACQRTFIRYLFTLMFTGLLSASVFLVFKTINALFSLQISTYVESATMVGLMIPFHAVFFLTGFPDPRETHDKVISNMMRVFLRFILTPLVLVFFVIIYAYTVTEALSGLSERIAYATLWLAGGTWLLLVLSVPLAEQHGRTSWFYRVMPILLLPLIILSGIAWWGYLLSNSVSPEDYAYSALLCAAFIASAYATLTGRVDPRVLPSALFVLAVITMKGPVGYEAVALRTGYVEKQQEAQLNEVQYYSSDLVSNKIRVARIDEVLHVVGDISNHFDDRDNSVTDPESSVTATLRDRDRLVIIDPKWNDTLVLSVRDALIARDVRKESVAQDEPMLAARQGSFWRTSQGMQAIVVIHDASAVNFSGDSVVRLSNVTFSATMLHR
jgi:hypothetical protein